MTNTFKIQFSEKWRGHGEIVEGAWRDYERMDCGGIVKGWRDSEGGWAAHQGAKGWGREGIKHHSIKALVYSPHKPHQSTGRNM